VTGIPSLSYQKSSGGSFHDRQLLLVVLVVLVVLVGFAVHFEYCLHTILAGCCWVDSFELFVLCL